MTARQVLIRDGVYNKIVADSPSYIITDLDIEKTYFPREDLEDLGAKPFIKVVAMTFGTSLKRELRKVTVHLPEVPVQVAIQRRIADRDDVDSIDKLVELSEQVMLSCMDDDLVLPERYRFNRIDPLRDENNLIYSYEELTVRGVFNAIFTAVYQHVYDL